MAHYSLSPKATLPSLLMACAGFSAAAGVVLLGGWIGISLTSASVINLKLLFAPIVCLVAALRCFSWGYDHFQRWVFLGKSKVRLDPSGLLVEDELVPWPEMRLDMVMGELNTIRLLSTGNTIPVSGLQEADQFRKEFKALTAGKFETSGYFKQ